MGEISGIVYILVVFSFVFGSLGLSVMGDGGSISDN